MLLDILVVICILLSLQFLALVGIFVALLIKGSPYPPVRPEERPPMFRYSRDSITPR